MKTHPSPHGPDGRDPESGRFLPGNRLGKGSPLAGRAARLRGALLSQVKPRDIRQVCQVLLRKAKRGDLVAVKLLLDRVLGPPIASDVEWRLETLERLLEEAR